MTRDDALERIRAETFMLHEECAERIDAFRWGRVFTNRTHRRIWDFNFARVEREVGGEEVDDLIADVDAAMAGLGHRQVWMADDALGRKLGPLFSERGWKVERHVVMQLLRDPDRRPDTSRVIRVDENLAWPAREEWLRSYEDLADDETMTQLLSQYRIVNALRGGEDYGVVDDGKVVSFALLRSHEAVAEVTDVATLEPYRKRGLARACVWRVVERARELGDDVVFLVADDQDWPKDLYSKLGFDAVAYQHYFMRTGVDEPST